MRILQLVTARQRRGAEVFATQLSDALSKLGHEVLVAGLYPSPANPLTPQHAPAIDLPVRSSGRLNIRRLSATINLFRSVRPDVVQANGSETLKYSSCARRIAGFGGPVIYRNISMASMWVRGPAHRAWGRWLVSALDHVASVSEESSRDFGATYCVSAERRSVIRRGIEIPSTPQRAAARRELEQLAGTPREAPLLVHIGSYTPEKNHAWLVDSFRRIRAMRPDVHLLLIGEGELRSAVEARVREHGLRSCVHLLGPREDASGLLAGADVLVLPSKIEGIPGVVLEAAAQGVPSVATDVGGLREAVHHGGTGFLVAPDDERGFVSSVLALLSDESRRRVMGIAALALVREKFSLDASAGAFEALYSRLLGEPASRAQVKSR